MVRGESGRKYVERSPCLQEVNNVRETTVADSTDETVDPQRHVEYPMSMETARTFIVYAHDKRLLDLGSRRI